MRPLLLFAALLAPSSAAAECMEIRPFLAGPEIVPPNPRLILFWPRGLPPKNPVLAVKDAQGRPLAFRLERLSRVPAYDAYALTVAAGDKSRFTVSSSTESRPGVEGSFTVSSAWAKPDVVSSDVQVFVSTFARESSFERVRAVSVPAQAAAYLIEWMADEDSAPTQSVVVPAQMSWFHYPKEPARVRAELKLGHFNCGGWNFRWDDPAITLLAFPLLSDGGRGDASGPLRVSAPPHLGEDRTENGGAPPFAP